MLRKSLIMRSSEGLRQHHPAVMLLIGNRLSVSAHQYRKNQKEMRSLRQLSRSSQNSNGINYSYQEDQHKTQNQKGVTEMLGDSMKQQPSKPVVTSIEEQEGRQTYVPFFQEVQRRMEAKYGVTPNKSGTENLFDALVSEPSPAEYVAPNPSPKPTTRPVHKPPSKAETSFLSNIDIGESIFKNFPLPDSSTNSSAFDQEAYEQYVQMIDHIVVGDQFTRNHTRKPIKDEVKQPVIDWLRRSDRLLNHNYFENVKNDEITEDYLKFQLRQQHDNFIQLSGLDTKQAEMALGALNLMGSLCAREGKSLPLEVAWEKLKEAGMVLQRTGLNSYLYTCTMYTSKRQQSPISNGASINSVMSILDPDITDSKFAQLKATVSRDLDNTTTIAEEIAVFHDVLYSSTEQSLTVRVKAMVAREMGKEAEAVLEAAGCVDVRLRTFLPILQLYQRQGEIDAALTLFDKIRNKHGIILEPESYVQLIAAVAENGYFAPNPPKDKNITCANFKSTSGSDLFDELVAIMAEDVLEISAASARRLYSAFSNAFQETHIGRKLERLHPLTPLHIHTDAAADDELVANRVKVDTNTGQCLRTGAKLRLITLDTNQRAQVQESLLRLSEEQYENYTKGVRVRTIRAGTTDPHEHMLKFFAWMNQREGKPFTAIVDGANVGYYMQNFEHGKFNFHQIQFVIEALEDLGENPLVILPSKYCHSFFTIRRGVDTGRQVLDKNEMAILERLKKSGKLYAVPPYCLDDYYWMVASVSNQTASRKGVSLDVAPNDPNGRWPGTRPMLITNDQMRDHKFELMEPRLFRRWFASHIVNYNFTGFVGTEKFDTRIGYSPADFFSREIQANPSFGRKGIKSGTAWHFPVIEWSGSERFSVRIPNQNKVG